MKQLAALLVVVVTACTTVVETPTTIQQQTTTIPTTQPATTQPPTTTTVATTQTLPYTNEELAYLTTVEPLLTNSYGDYDTLIKLGHGWCVSMSEAKDSGLTRNEWIVLVGAIVDSDGDPNVYHDAMMMSAAAAGSICHELYDWATDG